MQTGAVTVWNDSKGYGFITPDDGAPDLFVHFSGIKAEGRRSLEIGGRVQFEMISDDRAKRAERVVKILERAV